MYDTDECTLEVLRLKVAPAKSVLRIAEADEERERNKELESFVEQIGRKNNTPDLDFLANLNALVKSEGVSDAVAQSINKVVEMSDG